MRKHIYSKELENEIKNSKYIPRKIKENEHLKLYHKYWIQEYKGIIKVYDVWLDNGIEYYYIKNFNTKLSYCISYPIDSYSNIYELLHNHNNIENESIINSDKSYTGAEIKFWFIANNIDLSDNNYYGFWKYLNINSNKYLVDNKFYFLIQNKNNTQIILDKHKVLGS